MIGDDYLKKFFFFLLTAIITVGIFFAVRVTLDKDTDYGTASSDSSDGTSPSDEALREIRAVWISYFELTTMNDDDKSEKAFRKKAETMIKNCADAKINTVYLHVRPSSDAFYRSEIFPFSMYLTGTEGKDPGFDPLSVFCEYSEKYGIELHAWINPFRVCSVSNLSSRSEKNPAVKILNDSDPDNDKYIVTVGNGIYYNPSYTAVHSLINDGVREILENYPVKGIHIDDYFYPTTDAKIDSSLYEEYTQNGGTLPRDGLRREYINSFVSSLYRTVKSFGDDKIFSISPGSDIEKNYNEHYADVEKWVSSEGYCDYLIPQVYYGFNHEKYPFSDTADSWSELMNTAKIPIVFGLAVYKSGQEDSYAGTGADEWTESTDIISRQIEYVRSLNNYGGFSLYSYSYAYGENLNYYSKKEITSVTSML